MAPALTIGFIVRSSLSSTAMTELNGRPVPLTPSSSRARVAPISWSTRAKTNGLETLCSEKGCVASPTETTLPSTPTTEMPNSAGSTAASAGM